MARKNLIKSALNRKMKATKQAFSNVRSNSGQQTYRPLELYEKLKPEDFSKIAEKYGINNTIDYIKTMEAIKLGGKNGS